MASTKKRAQGGGRTPNSEPKQQVFKEFNGCNFELSPRDFTLGKLVDQEQSDLQMNYVVIQNNAGITSNKTIETRNNLVKLFDAPPEKRFEQACILINDELYLSLNDGSLVYGTVGDPQQRLHGVTLTNKSTAIVPGHDWRSFAFIDNKIVGTTEQEELWTGDISSSPREMSNAKEVPNPTDHLMPLINIVGHGDLEVVAPSMVDDDHPYRIAVAYAFINKYGPTQCSDQSTFYTNYPIDEWYGSRYVTIQSDDSLCGVDPDDEVLAVELYYTSGNSSSLIFCGRTDQITYATPSSYGNWSFDWFGYLDATSMWPIANLIAPTANYTKGPPASHVTCIDSRVYFWGSDDEPQRLYIGGNSGNLFSISPGTGGGFVDIEPGTGQDIRIVTKYKTQSGNSIVTMLCNSQNSSLEQRFNLVENAISLSNEQSMKSWQAEQVAGAVGCKSYNGAIVCEDGLYSISRYGLALTTMTMEYNSQIRTNYVSDPIKPVFVDKNRYLLRNSVIIECDGVIYVAFGYENQSIDNLLFCYDIDQKAWWTVTLDIDEPILNMIHIDYEGYREGIGIVTANAVYMLPLTIDDSLDTNATFQTTIQTGELSTTQPQQNWSYLSQIEFRFDYFRGSALIELTGIDQFGRKVSTKKTITHTTTQYNLAEYLRVDLRLQSYQIRITGIARFRLTHFIAKLYAMSGKQGLVWGFDDSQTFRQNNDIHPTFNDYNDIKKAVIP